MKILLVDDEKKFVTMLAKRLELRGIESEFFFSGLEALAKVGEGERFDVAVLDVKMPGIGGIDLKRRLSGLDPELKYIFLTGHGSNIDFERETNEAVHYLAKPLKIDELIETLHKLAGA